MTNEWKPTNVDLVLAAGISILLPLIAQFLYLKTGAFIPMLLYYGLAWGLVKWRRGSIGYFNSIPLKFPIAFFINIGVILLSLVCAFLAPIVNPNPDIEGTIITALIWAPLNAATEQILWIYIFEAWDLYNEKNSEQKGKSGVFSIIGLILFSTFVGMIHTMYWVQFLHVVDSTQVIGIIFVLLTTISGFLHIVVWKKSNKMILTFIPHFLLNLIPLFWTKFSILPYLFI
jgi:hypothetical protein